MESDHGMHQGFAGLLSAHCYIESTPPFRTRGIRFERGKIPLSFYPDRLELPLRWRRPRRVFVNSMSDLFHEDVADAFIDQVFAVMTLAPTHTFQILTKRAERMRGYLLDPQRRVRVETARHDYQRVIEATWSRARLCVAYAKSGAEWDQVERAWPLPNVWLGVSVENQATADERIPLLLQTPAAVRFLSCEPLLSDIWLGGCLVGARDRDVYPQGVDWVIVGGESGPKARPCHITWVRSILDQCQAVGVPCFVKQLGANVPLDATGVFQRKLRDRKGGDIAEWPEDLRVRQYPGPQQCAHGRVEGDDCPDCAAELEDCL